jgi:predicted acyl esterase
VTLHAATSAPDTDFTAKLVDVYPDGRAISLNNGIIRARFRNSLERAEQVTPGQVHEYTIQIWPTSNNFPHYDRDLNTGHESEQDSAMLVAEQTIYHDRERALRVVLPIIPQVLL